MVCFKSPKDLDKQKQRRRSSQDLFLKRVGHTAMRFVFKWDQIEMENNPYAIYVLLLMVLTLPYINLYSFMSI